MSARRQGLNAVLNLLWTAIFLGPLYAYCAREVPARYLYLFAALASLTFLVPKSLLQRLRLSADAGVYRRLGVPLFVKSTQDAPWIRRLSGDLESRVRRDRGAIARMTGETWMRERFHLGLLVFFGLCSCVALWRMQLAWFLALTVCNVLYNVYPVLLQQFLRLRLTRLVNHEARVRASKST